MYIDPGLCVHPYVLVSKQSILRCAYMYISVSLVRYLHVLGCMEAHTSLHMCMIAQCYAGISCVTKCSYICYVTVHLY